MANNSTSSFDEFENKTGEENMPAERNSDDPPQAPEPRGRGEKASPVKGMATENGVRDVNQLMTDDAKRMREKLNGQPKVDFYIPLTSGEKLGQAYESVTINGYRLEVKKGMMVRVPKQVADMLAEFLNIQTSIGVEIRLDNKSEETQRALS